MFCRCPDPHRQHGWFWDRPWAPTAFGCREHWEHPKRPWQCVGKGVDAGAKQKAALWGLMAKTPSLAGKVITLLPKINQRQTRQQAS